MTNPRLRSLSGATRDRFMVTTDKQETLNGWEFPLQSARWVELFDTGSQTIAAGGASDYASEDIAVWMFDQLMLEFTIGGSTTDADVLITPKDSQANDLTYYLVMDTDNAAMDDIKAIFAQTGINSGGTAKHGVMVIDRIMGIHTVSIKGENDDGANGGTFNAKLYGRRFNY